MTLDQLAPLAGTMGGGAALVVLMWRAYKQVMAAVGKAPAAPTAPPEYTDKSLRDLVIIAIEDGRAMRSDVSELKASHADLRVEVASVKGELALIKERDKLHDVADELEDTLTDVKTDLKQIRQSNAEITGKLQAITPVPTGAVAKRRK